MTPTDRLTHALPADPDDDGPIGIPNSADLRKVLAELHTHRVAHDVITGLTDGPAETIPDGGE